MDIEKLNYVPGEYEAFTDVNAGVITFGVSQYFVLKDDYKSVVADVAVYADGVLMLPSEYTLSVDVKYTDIESTRTVKTLYSKIEVTNAAHDGKALTVDGNNFGSYTDNEANTLRVNTVVVTSALTSPLPYTNYLIDASGGAVDVTLPDATASTGEWYSFTLSKDSNHCNITTAGGQHIGDLLELSISTLNARVILQPSDATVYDGSAGYEIASSTRVNSRTIPVTGSLDLSGGFESGATYESILPDSTAIVITVPDWHLSHVGDFAIFSLVAGLNSSVTVVNESATFEQVITELEKQFVMRVGSSALHKGQDSRSSASEATLNFFPTTTASDIDPTYIKAVGSIGDPAYDEPAVDIDLGTVSSTTVEISLGKVADDSLQLGGTLPSRNVISLPNVRVTETGADRGVLLKFKYYKRNLTTDVETLILETEWSTPINSTTFGQYSIVGLLPQETWDGFVVIAEIVAIRRSGAGVAPNVELRNGGSSPSRSTLNVPASNITHDSLAAKMLAGLGVVWGHISNAAQTIYGAKTFAEDVVIGTGVFKTTTSDRSFKAESIGTSEFAHLQTSQLTFSKDSGATQAVLYFLNGILNFDKLVNFVLGAKTAETGAENAAAGAADDGTLTSYGGLAETTVSKGLGNVVSTNTIAEREALGAKALVAREDVVLASIGSNTQHKSLSGFLQSQPTAYTNRTYQIVTPAESDFYAVRICYKNDETTTTVIDSTTVCANETNTGTPTGTLIPVTFGGVTSVTLPAVLADGSPSLTFSDWVPLDSIARSDGGTLPLLLVRSFCNTTANNITTYNATSQPSGEWLTGAGDINGRMWDVGSASGDSSTTEATSLTDANFGCIALDVLFMTPRNCVDVVAFGDSITNGDSSGGNKMESPVHFAVTAISTDTVPIAYQNRGISAATTDVFLDRLTAFLGATNAVSDVIVYSAFSPNDVSVAVGDAARLQAIEDMKPLVLEAIDACRIAGKKIVLSTGLPYTWTTTIDNARKSFNTWVLALPNGKDVFTVDYDAVLTDGSTPAVITPAYTVDTLHPNTAGYKLLGAELEAIITDLTTKTF